MKTIGKVLGWSALAIMSTALGLYMVIATAIY